MQQAIKILHLEDTSSDAELIHRELRKAKLLFDVMVVDNKEDYLNALINFSPQIILSDHSLPFFNSSLALTLLQELGVPIPFILVTATVSEEFAVDIIKRGATDYILKDRLPRLATAVLKALENSRLEAERQFFLQQLVANETLMSDAQMLAHFGNFDICVNTNCLILSNEAYAIFGFKPGESPATHQLFYSAPGNEKIEAIRITIGEVFIDLNSNKKNYTLIDRAGCLKFISAEFKIEKKSKQATHVKGFLYDITKLKAAEHLLQESEANLKTIFETTDTGYIFYDKNQQTISFNSKAANFVAEHAGLHLKAGMFAHDLVAETRRVFINEVFTRVAAGETITYEKKFNHRKVDEKWMFFRWLPITGANKKNHGVVMALSDITDRKFAEIEREKISNDLIARNNALEQFTYIVSHNLRAPVANIIGLANLLTKRQDLPEDKFPEFLDALISSTNQLDGIVVDLNNILRITQNKTEEKQVVYFQQFVEDSKRELRDVIKKNDVSIYSNFTNKMYMLSIKSYLNCIFFNLIINSINFRQCNRQLRICIKSVLKEHTFELIFSDNGKGIDLQKFGNKIFGLYQKFDDSAEGKGMGLCMVKNMVTNLGGAIRVESEINVGTTFTIELPL